MDHDDDVSDLPAVPRRSRIRAVASDDGGGSGDDRDAPVPQSSTHWRVVLQNGVTLTFKDATAEFSYTRLALTTDAGTTEFFWPFVAYVYRRRG